MSPHTLSFRTWNRTSPLLQMRLWHLGVLVALVAIAIADIQDHGRRSRPDSLAAVGLRGIRLDLLALLARRAPVREPAGLGAARRRLRRSDGRIVPGGDHRLPARSSISTSAASCSDRQRRLAAHGFFAVSFALIGPTPTSATLSRVPPSSARFMPTE